MPAFVIKPLPEVIQVLEEVLIACGADQENARIVAEHLAMADASGVVTHGMVHLPSYVQAVADGGILPAGKTRIIDDAAAFALMHGGWSFGQVGALKAIDLAVTKATQTGIAMVGLVGTHHIGRLGHYVERAAGQGCAAQVWAGGYSEEDPQTAAYGGLQRVLSTNPIAFGFPGGRTPPVTFDFATTRVAGMKVAVARRHGTPLPAESIIGPDGLPTTDPEDYFRGGALLPFGGHKGYAISVEAEWLGRMLTGSDRFAEAGMGSFNLGHQGVLFIAARADAFAAAEQVREVADDMYERIRSSQPAPGVDRVLMPGQLEAEARTLSMAEGVRIDIEIWEAVSALPRSSAPAVDAGPMSPARASDNS
jgi:LDH2 family malate/lactate/ureidoglycolate dehydrogenase